jgi:hypothetical protein
MISNPAIPIVRDGIFNKNERTIKLKPMADITSIIISRKCISYHKAKLMNVNSNMTNQMPLFSRKVLFSERLLLLLNEM